MAISTEIDESMHQGIDTPTFVKENFKKNLMGKSFDEIIHDQTNVDHLIGGVASEFVEVDPETLQK